MLLNLHHSKNYEDDLYQTLWECENERTLEMKELEYKMMGNLIELKKWSNCKKLDHYKNDLSTKKTKVEEVKIFAERDKEKEAKVEEI